MPKVTPTMYARVQALVTNPEYLQDLELARRGLMPSNIKNKDGKPIQEKDLVRVDLAGIPRGFSNKATTWLLDKYKLNFLITPEWVKSQPKSKWNEIAVFTHDVRKIAKRPVARKARASKMYHEGEVSKASPKWGFQAIGPAVLTPEMKQRVRVELDRKYERRFSNGSGQIRGDAPDREAWKAAEYRKRTGQEWEDS